MYVRKKIRLTVEQYIDRKILIIWWKILRRMHIKKHNAAYHLPFYVQKVFYSLQNIVTIPYIYNIEQTTIFL